MSEETATATTEEAKPVEETTTDEQRVPYERFQQANKKAKEAAERAKALEKDMAELRSQMEEREHAGLPELERERKRAEQLEKRLQDAEKKAEEQDRQMQRNQRERLVINAAKDFADPEDAVAVLQRSGAFDDIESTSDAERAVKRVAKDKPHLLKQDEPRLPGKVLDNGQRATATPSTGGIDLDQEAQMVSNELKRFLANRQQQ